MFLFTPFSLHLINTYLILINHVTRLSHFDFDAFFDTFTFDTAPFDFDTSPFDFDSFNFKAF